MKIAARGSSALAGALACALLSATGAGATTLTYDFNAGLGAEFETFSTDGLFAVDTSGQNVRISKPADDLSLRQNPNEFISGGVQLNLALGGDFVVTVDFTLHDFPPAPGQHQLNESVLAASSISNPGNAISILRLRVGSQDLIELFAAPPGLPFGIAPATANSGRYRLERTGSDITASYAIGNSASFTTVATASNVTDPYRFVLAAVQGANLGPRSSTALDISFDNLIVEADFVVPTPEPAALALLGLGLAGLGLARRSRAG